MSKPLDPVQFWLIATPIWALALIVGSNAGRWARRWNASASEGASNSVMHSNAIPSQPSGSSTDNVTNAPALSQPGSSRGPNQQGPIETNAGLPDLILPQMPTALLGEVVVGQIILSNSNPTLSTTNAALMGGWPVSWERHAVDRWAIPRLAPGDTNLLRFELTPTIPGKHVLPLQLQAGNAARTQWLHLEVIAVPLSLAIGRPQISSSNRMDIPITVWNLGAHVVKGINVAIQDPSLTFQQHVEQLSPLEAETIVVSLPRGTDPRRQLTVTARSSQCQDTRIAQALPEAFGKASPSPLRPAVARWRLAEDSRKHLPNLPPPPAYPVAAIRKDEAVRETGTLHLKVDTKEDGTVASIVGKGLGEQSIVAREVSDWIRDHWRWTSGLPQTRDFTIEWKLINRPDPDGP